MNFRWALATILIVLVLSAVHLSIYTGNINLKYEVENLKRTLIGLKLDIRQLQAINAQNNNLDRIERIAKGPLGMVRPDKLNYVIISSEVSP